MYSSSRIKPSFAARQMSLGQSSVAKSYANRQVTIAKLLERQATGLQINRPSDDPAGFGVAEGLDTSLKRYEQYQRTMSSARLWIDTTESALNGLSEILTNANEQGIRAINGTLSADDLEAIASQIDVLLESYVETLNTKAGSEYVFAGTANKTPPFALDSGPSADASGVTYNGNAGNISRSIGDDVDVDVNFDGDTVNNTSSGLTATEALAALASAIRSGDADAINAAIEDTTTARDHVLTLTASIGGTSQRLQSTEEQLANTILAVSARRSAIEDADLASTVTELQLEQLRMQAATQALLSIQQLDITNFLR